MMKHIRKIIPVFLMVWPYMFLPYMMLSDKAGGGSGFLTIYIIGTIVVYAFNIWNAWTYPREDAGCKLAFYDMVAKLVHIPFYIGVFVAGVLLALAMVVPALLFVSPILIFLLAAIDFFLMMTSSMYGISAAVRLSKKGGILKRTAILHILLHLIFVADVVSAVCLYRKTAKYK